MRALLKIGSVAGILWSLLILVGSVSTFAFSTAQRQHAESFVEVNRTLANSSADQITLPRSQLMALYAFAEEQFIDKHHLSIYLGLNALFLLSLSVLYLFAGVRFGGSPQTPAP